MIPKYWFARRANKLLGMIRPPSDWFANRWWANTVSTPAVFFFFRVPGHARSSVRWVRRSPQSAAVSQPVPKAPQLSEQVRPWDTITCCWDVEQPTNNKHHDDTYFSLNDNVCWLVACLTSQQHASVSQGRICSDVLPHWDRSCRSNFLPHPVTVYWHRADQSQRWPYNSRRLVWLDPEKIPSQAGFEPGIFRSPGGHLNH